MSEHILTETDRALRRCFEAGTLGNDTFHHHEHVRLTWGYLTERSVDEVGGHMCRALLQFAASRGARERFHHTLTIAWVRLIAGARITHLDLGFDQLASACPWLLDKDAPLSYYTRDRLYADEARQRWIEPDVQPLPTDRCH